MKEALIIFIKNPEPGKVKTRLAATIWNEKALEIYHHLMRHTREVALQVEVDRHVFYSQFIDKDDYWSPLEFEKHLQDANPDLGQKMFSSFDRLKKAGYERVLIVGSDCLELSPDIIKDGFVLLNENEAVIGPAKDGGYYSIGFNFKRLGLTGTRVMQDTFLGKTWSHEHVCSEAITALDQNGLKWERLPVLSDVDVEADVKHLL